jgi:hypothetical protein
MGIMAEGDGEKANESSLSDFEQLLDGAIRRLSMLEVDHADDRLRIDELSRAAGMRGGFLRQILETARVYPNVGGYYVPDVIRALERYRDDSEDEVPPSQIPAFEPIEEMEMA